MLLVLAGCYGGDVYIVKGVVVEVHPPTEVVLDHEEIPGLMGAMVMPFTVEDPAMIAPLRPGDRVLARYELRELGGTLIDLRVTGHGPAPVQPPSGPVPVRVGEGIAATVVPLADGGQVVLGPDQTERVLLTYVYTRCPVPEFCPATITKLQAVQAALPADAAGVRILVVTLDPAYDTAEVLTGYATQVGAGPRWSFGRLEAQPLADLAMRSGLRFLQEGGPSGSNPAEGQEIAHSLRTLVLDRGGKLIERYDDTKYPVDRVVQQLTTGAPTAPAGNSGTLTP